MMTAIQSCPCWGGGSGMGGSGMAGGGMWGVGFLWPLLWFLLIAIIAIAALYLLWERAAAGRAESPDRAIALLREQYARGELTDEEYENRVERLTATEPL